MQINVSYFYTYVFIVEFPRRPHWKEVLEALMIRGDLIGLRQDIYESFYVCQGDAGALDVYFRQEQRRIFSLEPRNT